jgi:tRNA(Ile2) C34 agmatinyltransferase TiaS
MKCPSCGRELTSIKSILRGRGYRCACKRKETDKQIKLNFEEGKNDTTEKIRSIGTEGKNI